MDEGDLFDPEPESDPAQYQAQLQEKFNIAYSLIEAGFSVFPAAVYPDTNGSLLKKPLTFHGHLDATTDKALIREWLISPPHAPAEIKGEHQIVVAFVPGSGGCGVLDCDIKHGKSGATDYQSLVKEHGPFVTSAWRSPSGGANILFKKPPGASYSNRSPWLGIDVRVDNGWVVAPGNKTPWGDWEWHPGTNAKTATELPPGISARLQAAEMHGAKATAKEAIDFIEASPRESAARAHIMFGERIQEFRQAGPGARHEQMKHITSWAFGMERLDLRWARLQIQTVWDSLMNGEGRADEVDEFITWVVGQEIKKRANGSRPTTTTAPVINDSQLSERLPESFWSRQLHAEVRVAARRIGLSAEALMLAVLVLVATHVPPAITIPGPRRGVVNPLGALVGPPGTSKGTTLDRAAELLPPPINNRWHVLGTAQGFVKEFFRRSTPQEKVQAKLTNADVPEWVRHYGPVIVRTDEIATFAAATRKNSDNGDRLLGELKRAVSGEILGSGYATDEKNLRCAPLSYRAVGLLGVAPAKAAPLFDDLGGGMPERLLFAPAEPEYDPPNDPSEFGPNGNSTQPASNSSLGTLNPLNWQMPLPIPNPQAFTDTGDVNDWIIQSFRYHMINPRPPLDAHTNYLRHMISATIALLDSRWLITGDDFVLAGMIMTVSNATRTRLLQSIEAEQQRIGQAAASRRRTEVLKTDAELIAQRERQHKARLSEIALRITGQVGDNPNVTVKELRNSISSTKRAEWDEALDEAKANNWITEKLDNTTKGGAARRLSLGSVRP